MSVLITAIIIALIVMAGVVLFLGALIFSVALINFIEIREEQGRKKNESIMDTINSFRK